MNEIQLVVKCTNPKRLEKGTGTVDGRNPKQTPPGMYIKPNKSSIGSMSFTYIYHGNQI